MSNIRLPGLMDANMTEVIRLHPSAETVTLKMIGSSEATMTLPEDESDVHIHDWISIYTQRGFAGIFRVSNVVQNYRKQYDVTLLHGIDVLADSVWAAQMDFTGTKRQFIEALLAQQTHLVNGMQPWVLNVCEDTNTYEKTINYDRLSDLLEELVVEGGSYYFTYNQSVFPWQLNYVAKSNAVDSEFRLTRNIRTASVTYNDADLCTRLHLSVSHKSKTEESVVTHTDTIVRTYNNLEAQARWGVVVKTADIDTKDDIADEHFENADAWAQNYMNHRQEPSVQIQIDGDELARMTGAEWDELSIGMLCQVALPAYGHTFLERVVSVTYPEVLKDPAHVTVSLANVLPKFSENIATAQKTATSAAKAARGGARGAASAEELETWSKTTKKHQLALDGTGVMTMYESGIVVDADEGVTITSLIQGLQSFYSEIKANAGHISLVVNSSAGGTASIKIDAITDAINQSQVSINADKIVLNGSTIANIITADEANFTNLISGVTKATLLNATSITADNIAAATTLSTPSLSIGTGTQGGSGTLYYRGTQFYNQGITLGATGSYIAEGHFLGDSSTTLNLNHYHKIVATEGTGADAGKIIITLSDPLPTSNTTDSKTNFSIAATTTYQNGVVAARYAGKNSVGITTITWNPVQSVGSSRTATVTTMGRTTTAGVADEISTSTGLYLTTSGLNSFLHIESASGTVIAQTACSDANLTAGNIKSGVTIFGVTGTYSGSSPSISYPSAISSQSTAFTNVTKTYSVNRNYNYLKLDISAGSSSVRLQIHLTD